LLFKSDLWGNLSGKTSRGQKIINQKQPLVDPCGQDTQSSKIIDGDSRWSRKGKLLKSMKV